MWIAAGCPRFCTCGLVEECKQNSDKKIALDTFVSLVEVVVGVGFVIWVGC